jgi:hypothetical protein
MSRIALCGLDAVAVGAPNLALGYFRYDDFDPEIARALADVEKLWAAFLDVVKVQNYRVRDATIDTGMRK